MRLLDVGTGTGALLPYFMDLVRTLSLELQPGALVRGFGLCTRPCPFSCLLLLLARSLSQFSLSSSSSSFFLFLS